MTWEAAPAVVLAVRAALEDCPVVREVTLGGSRSRGTATALSDWDLYLDGDPDAVAAEVPGLVAGLDPLAAFWEPLSEDAAYMTVMRGPVKVDLFARGARRRLQPPWQIIAETLAGVDGHFWDWMLWLGGKSLRGEAGLVSDELAKMQWFLLGPLGVGEVPASLGDAAGLYLDARRRASARFATSPGEELGRQVLGALRDHGLVP